MTFSVDPPHMLELCYRPHLSTYALLNPYQQVYKSTGDAESARAMFDQYSAVNNDNPEMPWLKWRAIVIARRRSGYMFLQSNTVKHGKCNSPEIGTREYSASPFRDYSTKWSTLIKNVLIYFWLLYHSNKLSTFEKIISGLN